MNQQLVMYPHPVDGYFEIRQCEDWVDVSCKWPFDTEADDWIEIHNKFSINNYSSAVRRALAGDRGQANGIEGGSITIEQSGAAQTIVEVSNSAEGWARRSLYIKIAKPTSSFMIPEQ